MPKRPHRWTAPLATAVLVVIPGASAWSAELSPAPGAEPTAARGAGERGVNAVALDPAGLLLFSITLNGLTLSEGLGAYGDQADPLLPVGELAHLLEADVDVLPVERRIVGRLGEARRSLVVDLASGLARIGPQEVRLTDADFAVSQTEIYLRASVLQKLLPLKIEVLPEELALRMTSTEAFPVEKRLQREGRRPGGSAVGGAEEESLKIVDPYRLFSPPSFDVVLDGGLQSGSQDSRYRYDVRVGADLLFADFQGFLGSDERGRATSARALLQRRSFDGHLLGPLHAREINVGDTYSPGLSLGPRSVAGRGLSFTTVPFDRTNVFNRIDLRGELPPGYDVELYVNDVLKSSTNQAVNGRYEFLDVPLSPGLNVVRIVTYGPRGQRIEDVQVVNVGAGLLQAGEGALVFGVVDQDQALIPLRSLHPVSSGGGAVTRGGGVRVVAGFNYGLTDRWTVTAGAARVPRFGRSATDLFTVGGRTSILGLAVQSDLGVDSHGGSAATAGVAGQFGSVSGVLRHAEYRGGFLDENTTGAASALTLRRRTELTLDSNIDLRGRIVPVSVRAIRDEYADGSYDILGATRASSSIGPILFSAGAEYQRQHLRPAPARDTLSGYLAASTYRGYRWQIRSTFDYEVVPDFRAKFLTVTVDRRLTELWSLRLGVGEPLDDLKGWNGVISSIYQSRFGDLALTGEYDNARSDWRISAQWSFGLGYDPDRHRYRVTRTGPGSGGSAIVDAFIDANGDGVRQRDEAGAPKVVVQGGQPHEVETGADGRAYVTGLGAGASARLDLDLSHVENSSVQTPPSRIALRPRPGSVARIEYPMRPTGEVMVRVELLRDDGKRVGLSSVRLQLVPETGSPQEATTEFDGSAIFEALPVATYRVQLDPRQAEKLRMRLLQQPTIVIKGDGGFTPDVVVQVKFDPAPAGSQVTPG